MPPSRRRPTSPPATPLEDEDLLAEFLLRLPPRPSSLPRAAAVCKAWRRIVTDPHFLRRFRAHHRKAPLLGFFDEDGIFVPTLEAPDRVPVTRLSVSWDVVACHDGLVLGSEGLKLQVLDPMTGYGSDIIFREDKLPDPINVEFVVDSTDPERLCFRLFALSTDAECTKLDASVYSSDSGAWVHSVETVDIPSTFQWRECPATLVGNAFYWFRDHGKILRYDLETQTLAMIEAPAPLPCYRKFLMSTKDGDLNIVTLLDEDEPAVQFWVRKTVLRSDAKWVLRKTVLLDMPLPLELKEYWVLSAILGFGEESNVIFLYLAYIGTFMINLEWMKCTKVAESEEIYRNIIYSYSSFMTTGDGLNMWETQDDANKHEVGKAQENSEDGWLAWQEVRQQENQGAGESSNKGV